MCRESLRMKSVVGVGRQWNLPSYAASACGVLHWSY